MKNLLLLSAIALSLCLHAGQPVTQILVQTGPTTTTDANGNATVQYPPFDTSTGRLIAVQVTLDTSPFSGPITVTVGVETATSSFGNLIGVRPVRHQDIALAGKGSVEVQLIEPQSIFITPTVTYSYR